MKLIKINSESKYYEYSIKFELVNSNIPLANSLRRCFSSMCPTICFDDTYHSDTSLNSIQIKKNTSSLHNEFLSHRISLIPIFYQNNEYFSIETFYDKKEGLRKWQFTHKGQIPTFILKIKNDEKFKSKRDKYGLINVNTEHFNIKTQDGDLIQENIHDIFRYDNFTDDSIIINKLKSNIINNDDGEELDLECYPTIGFGTTNSRHDPCGTVSYLFKNDEDSVIDENFKNKMKYLNEERLTKNLQPFTKDENNQMRKNFDLLDKERVYKKNENGQPTNILFTVESIGFMDASNIVLSSSYVLLLSLIDIRNSFLFKNYKEISLEIDNPLISIDIDNSVNKGIKIKIKNQNHTLGNLIRYYLMTFIPSRLKYAGYRKNHPTIEEIEFIIFIEDDIDNETLFSKNLEFLRQYLDDTTESAKSNKIKYLENIKIYCSLMFIKSINMAIRDLDNFIEIFKDTFNIHDPNFTIKDKEPHFDDSLPKIPFVITDI